MDLLSMDLSPGQRQAYRESRDLGAHPGMPPLKTCYNDWWESVQHGPFPPPFSLTRAHRRTVRGPHIVMRALLEKGRATLGKDAQFVIYNLYRRMPDPMFRVILSFL